MMQQFADMAYFVNTFSTITTTTQCSTFDPSHHHHFYPHLPSVAMAQATFFAILGEKLHDTTKIFEELYPIKSQGVFCQL